MKLEMYDSIETLKMGRFMSYNAAVLLDSEIGDDLDSFDNHIANNVRYQKEGDIESANKIMNNLRQNIQFIVSHTSLKMLSFVPMIDKIDGEKIGKLDDSDIIRLSKELQDIVQYGQVKGFLDYVKKKIDEENEIYFPEQSQGRVELFYTNIIRRTKLVCDLENDNKEKIKEIDDQTFKLFKPREFGGPKGVEVRNRKNYHDMFTILQQSIPGVDPSEMTVLEFRQKFKFLEKQANKK